MGKVKNCALSVSTFCVLHGSNIPVAPVYYPETVTGYQNMVSFYQQRLYKNRMREVAYRFERSDSESPWALVSDLDEGEAKKIAERVREGKASYTHYIKTTSDIVGIPLDSVPTLVLNDPQLREALESYNFRVNSLLDRDSEAIPSSNGLEQAVQKLRDEFVVGIKNRLSNPTVKTGRLSLLSLKGATRSQDLKRLVSKERERDEVLIPKFLELLSLANSPSKALFVKNDGVKAYKAKLPMNMPKVEVILLSEMLPVIGYDFPKKLANILQEYNGDVYYWLSTDDVFNPSTKTKQNILDIRNKLISQFEKYLDDMSLTLDEYNKHMRRLRLLYIVIQQARADMLFVTEFDGSWQVKNPLRVVENIIEESSGLVSAQEEIRKFFEEFS